MTNILIDELEARLILENGEIFGDETGYRISPISCGFMFEIAFKKGKAAEEGLMIPIGTFKKQWRKLGTIEWHDSLADFYIAKGF